jgi:sigma-B regulation protein RsbU (phosphoserine phosphatase)
MPIGIEEDARWERKTIELNPGDKLVMYTDGITEAQNENSEFFNEDQLIQAACSNIGASAFEVQSNILSSVKKFIGTAPQFDDITLMILSRDKETNE